MNLVVSQPQKLEGLLETITLLDKVSETITGKPASWKSGSGTAAGQGDDDSAPSPRDIAIANLPETAVMREQLTQHIEAEVKHLQKQVGAIARRVSKPGTAYKLNLLYARIRRLNGLLAHIAEAAYDMLKRLFIRVVIDRQSVV